MTATTPPAGPHFDDADGKGPWSGTDEGDAGPRNPWAAPPAGAKGTPKPTALDEFIKRARGGGSPNGPTGGGQRGPSRVAQRWLYGAGAALVAAVWLLWTGVHPIGADQRGVVSTLGAYSRVLDPGLQLTLPAPFETVAVVDTGKTRIASFPENEGSNLLLTGDDNLVDLTYSVQWNVANARDFAFRLDNPEQAVRDAAESAMRVAIVGRTFAQVNADNRAIEAQVANDAQRALDRYHAGVHVQGVTITRKGVPAKAVEGADATTAAKSEGDRLVADAQTYRHDIVANAQREADEFNRVYAQYKLAPGPTRQRLYYETMETVLGHADKTVVGAANVTPSLTLPAPVPAPKPAPPIAAPISASATAK